MLEALLFLFTGIIGLITILLMIKSYKSNQFFNIFLILIFVITSLRFLIHGSYKLEFQSYFKPDSSAYSFLYLIVVPCLYLYFKNLIRGEKSFNFNDLKHFIFIVIIYAINTISVVRDSFIFFYDALTNVILITLFFIFYIWQIFKLLNDNLWSKKDIQVHSAHYNLVKNWTIYIFAINILLLVSVLISIYTEYFSGERLSGKSMAIALLLFWLFIYSKILNSPEILYGLPILNKTLLQFQHVEINKETIPHKIRNHWNLSSITEKNDQDLRLEENIKSNILSYINIIDELSYKQNLFRGSKISQPDIAKKMNVPTSHIVYLFKYHSKITFSEYRMQSRIQDAIHLIENDFLKINTFESLAYKTGFSSYNPFYSAFKKITSLPPQEYISQQNKV